MNKHHHNKLAAIVAFAGLVTLVCSCRPSVQEVVAVLYRIPLGASRDEARQVLVEAYSSRKSKAWKSSIDLNRPPLAVTREMVEADIWLISGFRRRGHFVRVYPPDLFDKASPAFTDPLGLAADSSEGNGGVDLYYDAKTNYIGFLAYSTAKDRR